MKLTAGGGMAACRERLSEDLRMLEVGTVLPQYDALQLQSIPLLPEGEPCLNQVPPLVTTSVPPSFHKRRRCALIAICSAPLSSALRGQIVLAGSRCNALYVKRACCTLYCLYLPSRSDDRYCISNIYQG